MVKDKTEGQAPRHTLAAIWHASGCSESTKPIVKMFISYDANDINFEETIDWGIPDILYSTKRKKIESRL